MRKLCLSLFLLFFILDAKEPISPLPVEVEFDYKKANLGRELFFDTTLSKDGSVACVNCHNVYDGGADRNVVSIGFNGRKGNIQSPTVLNARYNFRQFWNGRAADLKEQVKGPLLNPVEHNMTPEDILKVVESSNVYRDMFKSAYGSDDITLEKISDAIAEFEKALVTPNSRFDKFLRNEIELDKDEKEGYILFKQNGCITCHNGINIGGNSFQKMGIFIEYKNKNRYPDRYQLTKNISYKNVFKVPTLRNISKTAPYFHDGSVDTLFEAVQTMAKYNLGLELDDKEVKKIVKFLNSLDGDMPKILDDR